MRKVNPIKPSEVTDVKSSKIPDEVIEAFNELIVENWNGNSAVVRQDEVVKAITKKLGIKRTEVFSSDWLDVEPIFRKAGWNVEYDKPGYNETYEATFEFSKKMISSETSDKVVPSTPSNVEQVKPENKNKSMAKTYTLKEAVLEAFKTLAQTANGAGISVHQVKWEVRNQVNSGNWEIPECANPNGGNIKFQIEHSAVRNVVSELYANRELDSLGFTHRTHRAYEGVLTEYFFTAPTTSTIGVDPASSIGSVTVATTVTVPPTVSNNQVASKVSNFLSRNPSGTVTLNRVRRAIKLNGVTCRQLATVVTSLGRQVVPAQNQNHYSEYEVV